MRKTISLYIFISLCIFTLAGCVREQRQTPQAEPETNITYESPSEKLKLLQGKIIDLTHAVITVQAEQNDYRFERCDERTITDGACLVVGEQVTITYAGSLVLTEDVQPVEIIQIKIENSDVSSQDTAKALMNSMNLAEKIAQLFIVRCPQKDAAQIAGLYQFGGYILFGRDFQNRTKDQVIAEIESYQNAVKIPMLIGVDEEGGSVNRVSTQKEFREKPFSSPRALYKQGGLSLIEKDTEEKSDLLLSLGINLNFAPVCDVSLNASDYMYDRSFGISAADTAQYVHTVVSAMNRKGLGCVLKHFPGYGNNADTHTGIAIDERSLESFRNNDFLPFQAGIKAGAPVVLVSHNMIRAVDGSRPASLSQAVHELLRTELAFDGLIITDDLQMDAIRQYTAGEEAAVMAVTAGNDLICCTDYETQFNAVLQAVQSGKISEQRIDESVLRILTYKLQRGMLE